MLYLYNGKIYVKPFVNKMVEVDIKKELNGEYNVIPTKNVIVGDNFDSKITSISVENAYKKIHKSSKED